MKGGLKQLIKANGFTMEDVYAKARETFPMVWTIKTHSWTNFNLYLIVALQMLKEERDAE